MKTTWKFKQFVVDTSWRLERGASIIESSILAVAVSILAIIAIQTTGYSTGDSFCSIAGRIGATQSDEYVMNRQTGACELNTESGFGVGP